MSRPAGPPDPLVSIGIPTFNRAATLDRALASAVGQTHARLEIIVADNASTDETPIVCARFAAADRRVRVVRRPDNIGPTANFNALVEACRGDFVMLLADDDWLAPEYVEQCLAALLADPTLALACGRARYFRGETAVEDGVRIDVAGRPADRVAAYFRAVGENGAFYGLMPAGVARGAFPMANVMGGDWLTMSAVAYLGGIRTLVTTTLSRSLGGTSETKEGIVAVADLSRAQAKFAHLAIGFFVLREIGWSSPLYAPLGRAPRLWLALRCQPPLLRHWRLETYGRLLAHPLVRLAQPVTRLRALRSRAVAARRRTPR